MQTQKLNATSFEEGEVSTQQRRVRGSCKWFNGQRGFGFIKGSNGEDYFVHQTSIISSGWRNLEVNQEVEFEVIKDNKRQRAINVTGPGGQKVKRASSSKTKLNEEICFAYQKGNCNYGDTCKFRHHLSTGMNDSPGVPGESSIKEVCNFWRHGTCHRGPSCKYLHQMDERNSLVNQSRGMCYDWQEGRCNQGRNCKFEHCPTEWAS